MARRALPRVKIDEPYRFREPGGERTLLDLFEGHPQLIVYHFMLGPGSSEGCTGCSYVEVPAIEAFKKRMGWTMRWRTTTARAVPARASGPA